MVFAEGAAFPEHGDEGEGEAGTGGDELSVPSRHPHHHPPLPHAGGEGHEPAPQGSTLKQAKGGFTFSGGAEAPTPRADVPGECWNVQLRLLKTWNFDLENVGF